MELEAVDLDGERAFGPPGIDFMGAVFPGDDGIEERARDVLRRLDQRLEAPLELALLGAGLVGLNCAPQRARTPSTLGALEDVRDRAEIKQPEPLGAIDGVQQLRRLDDGTEVKERPRQARDRDATTGREVLRVEHSRPVEPDAREAMPGAGSRDLYPGRVLPDSPEIRCRPVAKNGTRADRHYGGEIETSAGEGRERDGVDTAPVQRVKAPICHPAPNCIAVEAEVT